MTREPRSEGVEVRDVHEPSIVGRLFRPRAGSRHPGVAVFGGSEGGLDAQSMTASLLASHGYVALVVAYFGAEALPEHLIEIPLERLADGVRPLCAEPDVDGDRVAALAISKGAEGLLTAASLLPDLRATPLVLISPSSEVWQAVGDEGPVPDRSSWTRDGVPVPCRPMNGEALMPELLKNAVLGARLRRRQQPILLRLALAYEIDRPGPEEARIAAEHVTAPLLASAGRTTLSGRPPPWPARFWLGGARRATETRHHTSGGRRSSRPPRSGPECKSGHGDPYRLQRLVQLKSPSTP